MYVVVRKFTGTTLSASVCVGFVLVVMEVRSNVSSVFQKLGDKKKAKFDLCLKEFVYLKGTSNLRNHLDRAHPAEWSKVRTASSGKSDHGEGTKKHGAVDVYLWHTNVSSTRAGALTDAIVDFVALDLRPISVVNGVGFRRML